MLLRCLESLGTAEAFRIRGRRFDPAGSGRRRGRRVPRAASYCACNSCVVFLTEIGGSARGGRCQRVEGGMIQAEERSGERRDT